MSKGLNRVEAGFTLIEALVAMAIFALGALMVVPTMVAWVQANNVSLQKDEMGRILNSRAATIRYMHWDHQVWDTTISPGTVDDFATARSALEGASLQDLGAISAFTTPVTVKDVGLTASLQYAVVAITDSAGNPISKLMRLEGSWQMPGGSRMREDRMVQKQR